MTVEFKRGNGSKPLTIDTTSSNYVVYIRKNIQYVEAVEGTDGMNGIPAHYEYDEAIIDKKDYEENKDLILSMIFGATTDSITLINGAIDDLANAIAKFNNSTTTTTK